MKQNLNFYLCFLHFILLLNREAISTTDVPNGSFTTAEDVDVKVPDDLVWAEKEALEQPDNHKLGEEEFGHEIKHVIPFDKRHFDFGEEDWTVFNLPDSENEQLIVSISQDISKQLTISTTIRASSNIIITYQIHLTADDTSVTPSFSVFLITNSSNTLLKTEVAQEMWKTTTLHIQTQSDSQLLLVGSLNAHGNRITLRSFTIQDASSIQIRYGEGSRKSESEDILTGSEAHRDSFFNENGSVLQTRPLDLELVHSQQKFVTEISNQSIATQNENNSFLTTFSSRNFMENPNENFSTYNKISTDTNVHADYFENENFEEFLNENITESHSPVTVTDDSLRNSTENPQNQNISNSLNSTITELPSMNFTSPMNLTTVSVIGVVPSSAKGVFNFFVVIIICSVVIIAYMWWRRRRRNIGDDEIPVFSRSSTEHGNPTFTDNESSADVGLNRENQLNYRSFQ